ncbi:hypothetical protein [Psychromonas antarctica]|uniref:hypothetical protein n=1 Tax=Psychromonas antarctica TaxID=67573 RepID=UPI001EE832A0|nr:hypothetical protein [Psychromonas antarctica]MCG6201089.1 hypothetical protein [Psychromonas antarctica]
MTNYFNLTSLRRLAILYLTATLIACASTSKTPPEGGLPLPQLTEVISVPYARERAGKIDGVTVWQLPNAPGGERPDQCWLAVGSDAEGDIYISGHDHISNSMLYRMHQSDNTLRWVGDARTASQTANNWQVGESAEKFHTRPIAHNGRVYVATLDKSGMNTSYLSTRGFHWYGYDKVDNELLDLSASEQNGVGAAHLQIVTIQKDTKNNLLYGMSVPENKLLKYDVEQGITTVLGRPPAWNGYFYSNRFMWVDSRGRVYITGGSSRRQWNQDEPERVFNHVWYYDPLSGFGELPAFALQGANAIEVGQWDRTHKKLYSSDDQGNIYLFTDATASWTFLGRPDFSRSAKTWIFQLSADEKKIYIGRSDMGASRNAIYEYDIASGDSFELANMEELDKRASSEDFITGYDSWDSNGSFYIAAFSMNDNENVRMVAINPVRIKVAKGILPELVEVNAQAQADNIIVTRSGVAAQPLTLLYEVRAYNKDKHWVDSSYGELTFATHQKQIVVNSESIKRPNTHGLVTATLSLIGDGNVYVIGDNRQLLLAKL